MKKERKILLVVDPQNGFKNKNTEKALKKIDTITDYFDKVFVSTFFNPDNSMYQKVLHWHNFSKAKDAKYFLPAIKINNGTKVFKTHTYGKVFGAFRRFIKLNKVDTVYICGLQTDVGVYKTALDLFDMGIKPVVISDACGSCRGKTNHDMGIKMAKRQIGEDQVLTFKELKETLEHKVVEILM
jgi:nicotinamidase-related amidase